MPFPAPTNQEEAFLTDIVENSQDPAVWLIFSDWLQDQEDPRGEITRLWATERFFRDEFTPEQETRLEELLVSGLRPYLPGYTNSIGMEFVFVPRGTFWMGDHEEGEQKEVTIPHDFFVGVHPVTQGEWQAVMGTNPSHFSQDGEGRDKVKDFGDSQLRRFPVELVSWEDCQEFLKKLNEMYAGSDWLYRLPSDVEWEYACRGGATAREDCSYHFYFDTPTNDLSSEQANFNGNYPDGNATESPFLERTTQVGSFTPNRLGVFDMHGNVWEWCQDQLVEYPPARVFRGGSCTYGAQLARAGLRSGHAPVLRVKDLGFRCVSVRKSIEPPRSDPSP